MLEQLLEAARKLDDATLLPDTPELLLPAVPSDFSLDDISRLAEVDRDGSDTTAVLAAIYAALRSYKLGTQLDDDAEHKTALEYVALQVGQMMAPTCSGTTFDEDSTDYESLSRNGQIGLHILGLLLTFRPGGDFVLPTSTLLSIISFANAVDPWTSVPSAELAQSLLSDYFKSIASPKAAPPAPLSFQHSIRNARPSRQTPSEKLPRTERARFIIEDVLTGFLRPIFAKSRPTAVTASGRAAAFPEPPSRYTQGDGFGGADDIITAKPWKYTQRYAVTVFEWSVENADTDLLQEHWPLFTPVLLTLLDEPQPVSLKLRALSIFRTFWRLCPDGLLMRTGLADIFEQAVFPTVLNLPSLTPEAEPCDLLAAAYPALFDMAGLEDLDSVITTAKSIDVKAESRNSQAASDKRDLQSKGFSEAQRKLLDKLVREGIMVGYHHAKQYIRLVDFLCQTLRRLVSGMGILSVKHLKDTIPMVSEILLDPFGTNYPPVLLSATRLLQAILQTCWPRIPNYCNEIIKIVMLCWLNIEDEDSSPSNKLIKTEIQQQLIRTVEMLSAIMTAAKLDMSDRVSLLVAKDPQLRSLFTSCKKE
ncbi:hypothetical protein F5Y03DRAFT_397773 [Xylaria venustula]|nr:hypothetical protein F5Y03DRAFT_397773 [Xylaria venustula]